MAWAPPGCRDCGAQGEYDGWHLDMYERMARYQERHGLNPIGPHRKMADELLGPLTELRGACDGRGLCDVADGWTWEECGRGRGFGSASSGPSSSSRR